MHRVAFGVALLVGVAGVGSAADGPLVGKPPTWKKGDTLYAFPRLPPYPTVGFLLAVKPADPDRFDRLVDGKEKKDRDAALNMADGERGWLVRPGARLVLLEDPKAGVPIKAEVVSGPRKGKVGYVGPHWLDAAVRFPKGFDPKKHTEERLRLLHDTHLAIIDSSFVAAVKELAGPGDPNGERLVRTRRAELEEAAGRAYTRRLDDAIQESKIPQGDWDGAVLYGISKNWGREVKKKP